jgi:hypothetical protein
VVVLSGQDIETLCLQDGVPLLNGVINGDLVSAFTHLAFAVEHETATKSIDFVVIGARSMALTTLDALS